MERPPCSDNGGGVGVKKGPWTPEEDIVLVSYVQQHGPGNWRSVPENTGLMRCSKSCRLRWTNYLRPGIKRGNFTPHEEGIIIHLEATRIAPPARIKRQQHSWAAIASYLPQRTDNDIKNYWNTHLKKKVTKRLHTQPATTDSSQPSTASNLPAAGSPTNYYYSPSIITQQHNLQGMHTMSISYPNTAAAYGSAPTSSTATASPVSDLLQTWAMMRPSPPATAANYHQITMSMQEYREDRGEAAVVDCKQNQPVFIDDNKSSSSSGMLEAAPALMMGSSSAATFSLLEDWLLDDMPAGHAMDGLIRSWVSPAASVQIQSCSS